MHRSHAALRRRATLTKRLGLPFSDQLVLLLVAQAGNATGTVTPADKLAKEARASKTDMHSLLADRLPMSSQCSRFRRQLHGAEAATHFLLGSYAFLKKRM